jgi:hypothetical protein
MQPTPAGSSFAAMIEMLFGSWTSISLAAAAKFAVADQLESGPKTTKDLAAVLKVHEESLYRVLRALAGVGVFHEEENRAFSQTPLSELLRTNAKPSLRFVAATLLDNWHLGNLLGICSAVENGRPAAENLRGMGLFEYLAAHPDEAAGFNKCMTDLSSGEGPAVAASYDFSRFEHIVDVAGGAGGMLGAILSSAPKLRGTLFDQPSDSFGGRADMVGGDFFEGVPAGADAYIMKHIIHDWDDERATKILGNCRRAMKQGGTLLVVDRVLGPPNAPDPKKFFDVAMMLMPGGRERTEPEWNELFAKSGFRMTRIAPLAIPHSIIEGVQA